MATILPFLRDNNVFGPKDIQAMSIALDDVCNSLSLPNGPQRDVMAERIVELARHGIRNPTVLRNRLLLEAGHGYLIGLDDGPRPTA